MRLKILFIVVVLGFTTTMFSQTVVCEGAPCTSNDFTIETFYLGDINGAPFGPGYCEPGEIVNAYLWVDFTANAAADRYDLYLHFNLFVDGVFIETIDECYFDDEPIPTNVSLNTYNFNWECGAEIELQSLYMGWQTNNNGTCECSQSHCYSDPSIVVLAPLIANFSFEPSCDTAFTINFQSTTSGGLPPYTYLWDFGDGTSSTLANPTHTFASVGPYNISLTVNDQENTDSFTVEILEFDSNIFPEITAPSNQDIIGCSTDDISPFIYSISEIQISESELNTMGGSIVIGNDIVSLSYVDTTSGFCPITVTRTFTLVDSCNRTVNALQTISINDTIAPTASNPTAITVSCIGDVPTPNSDVVTDETDNCSTPMVQFVSDVSDGQTCPETITRSYSVTDACNNSITVTQTITINDTIAPTASNPLPINVTCIGDVPTPNSNVVTDEADNCSTPIVQFVSDVSDGQTCPETITRSYSVTDACNNSITVTQAIIINDTIAPVLISNLTTEQFIACGEIPEVPNILFEDNCTQDLVVNFTETINNLDDFNYDIIREWIAIDDCNNSTGFSQIIHVNTIEDAEYRIVNLCIEDNPIDLTNYITNTTFLDGIWSSDSITNWQGHIFTPTDMEVGGNYLINYSFSTNGCTWETTIEININDDCVYYPCIKSEDDVMITKMVTPNGDNNHDFLEIEYLLNEQTNEVCEIEISLELFNRWGVAIYKNENYNNDWDGRSPSTAFGNSKTLPSGTYYYIVKLKNSGLDPIQGFILLGTE